MGRVAAHNDSPEWGPHAGSLCLRRMMNISDLLATDAVLPALKVQSKKQLLTQEQMTIKFDDDF